MNIVFWLIVLVVVVLFWVCSYSAFREIGRVTFSLFHNVKSEMQDDNEDEMADEERKEKHE